MRYRKLAALFVAGLAVSAYYGHLFFARMDAGFLAWRPTPRAAVFLAAAAALQFAALALRAHKWWLLTRALRRGAFLDNLKCLSIGSVFNALFPLRLGELVRAHLLGRQLLVSRSAILCTIVFERALDGLFLSLFFLGLCAAVPQTVRPGALAGAAAAMLVVAAALMAVLALLFTENRRMLSAYDAASRIFNDRIRDGLRLVGWSAIHGTNLFLKSCPKALYLAETIAMWACYMGSMVLVLHAITGVFEPADVVVALVSLIGIGIPSGPGSLGLYHYMTAGALPHSQASLGAYSVWSWAVAVGPVSLAGAWFLTSSEEMRDRALFRAPDADRSAPMPALYRSEQSSPDFMNFLATYFGGLELSQLVGRTEMAGDVRLVKMLRGGSNALSLLVWTQGGHRVRKMSLLPFADKIRHQYEWLKAREGVGIFPKTLGLVEDDRSIHYDMEYYPSYSSFYSFIHNNEPARAKEVLTRIVDAVSQHVHVSPEAVESRADLDRYLKEKVLDKVNDCLIYDPSLNALLRAERLVVNGVEQDNFPAAMAAITRDAALMGALSRYRRAEIHGDLTVDNVLVDGDRFLLLDPNNENLLSDPLVDFAKLYQSLHSGYESLIRIERAEVDGVRVSFDEETSSRYRELYDHLRGVLEARVGPERLRLVKFHEAVHFARMLPYRLRINRASFPAFYAVMVRLFNEFRAEAGGGR